MSFVRRFAGALGVALALAAATPAALAQGYPNRPVRVIVPYPPGGGSDAAARLIANHLTQTLGQSFVVEYRPGGNTLIGSQEVARAAPDGYTLLMTGGSTMTLQPLVAEKMPFDAIADFAPIGMLSRFPFFVVAASSLPASNLKEMVAIARDKPGQFVYATNGTGTTGHLGMEMLATAANVKFTHVPYKGFAPAMPDVISGRVPVMMADLPPIREQVKAGALKLLAVTSQQRLPSFPNVPTVAESGFPGYEMEIWFAMFAPARTPTEIVARVSDAMRKYLSSPEGREAFAQIGHEAYPAGGDVIAKRIVDEQKAYAPVVKAAGLKN